MKKFEIKVYKHIKIEKLRYNFYILTTNRMHGASSLKIAKAIIDKFWFDMSRTQKEFTFDEYGFQYDSLKWKNIPGFMIEPLFKGLYPEHYFIFKEDFSFTQLAKELNKNRITISKRFNILIQNNFISEVKIKNKMAYKIEQQNFFINVSKNFINDFLCLPFVTKEEEFLKTYLWLKSQFQKGKTDFSYGDLIESFGHSKGNKKVYDRFKIILNELQNQKLIILDTQKSNRNKQGQFTKTFKILGINEN